MLLGICTLRVGVWVESDDLDEPNSQGTIACRSAYDIFRATRDRW